MEKILTVVVPTYNMEKYLDRCLSSLIIEPELMKKLEVIVVNDGSKDRSSEIAHSYAEKYPDTFIVVDKENGNYGSCVNKGMELATGMYFRILDADDWFDTAAFQEFIRILFKVHSDVVVTLYSTYYSDNVERTNYVHEKELYREQYLATSTLFPYEWLRMHQLSFRTDMLNKFGLELQCGISYTDTEFCYFPMKESQTVFFTDINLYQYCSSREGQTISLSSRISSLSHMSKVAMRLATDFDSNQFCANKSYLLVPLRSILFCFYSTAILNSRFTMQTINSIRKVDKVIRKNNDLYELTQKFSLDDLHFVVLWRRWGITLQCPLYKFYRTLKSHF